MNGAQFGLKITGVAFGAALFASVANAEVPTAASNAQVIILGEQHDNPHHHKRQAEWVAELKPEALVFEMLTSEQAARAGFDWQNQTELEAAIGWSEGAWPSFDMYFPIFAAAPDAAVYGAGVTRKVLRAELEAPLAAHPLAAPFGLDRPLVSAQKEAREALQAAAHCDALPPELLPVMVDAQRLRDAALADAALRALQETGGPVVVITGNGHARLDWGMPAVLAFAAPHVTVFALGQSEENTAVDGVFSMTLDAPAPARGDPCEAFSR